MYFFKIQQIGFR